MKEVFRKLWNFKLYLFIVILSIGGNVICNLSLPNYLSTIIDDGIVNSDMKMILEIGSYMLILTIIAMVSSIITSYFASRISMGIGRILRSEVFSKVQAFSEEEFDHFSTASLITRTNNDMTQIQNFLIMFLRIVIMAPVMCIGGIVMAILKSPVISCILFVSIPLLAILVGVVSKKTIPLSVKLQKRVDRINLVMREKLTGIRVMRAFGTEDYEAKRFEKANDELMADSLRMYLIIAVLEPLIMFILNFTIFGVLFIGRNLVADGNIMTGDIIAVVQYIMQIMMAVTMISVVFVMYPRASASAERINEILKTEPIIKDIKNPKNNTSMRGYLSFKNVTFSFKGADEPAVKNISFEAKPGETTAIIGSTGSGKTALINLIPRLYDVSEGEVLVDGINVKEYDHEVLRAKIGYVPQKALLFKGSINDNIKFGDEDADDDRVIKALKISQSYDFVMKKEDKLLSDISQGGSNVSGGQRQRLSIARAIVRKPEIYIFDDSFSALDFKTEAALRNALSKELENSTVIVVAQRVSTIMNADRIIVLENGEAVGIGKHHELIKNCPIYKEIVDSQISAEEGKGA